MRPPHSLRLEDSFLDEVLPLSVRQEALLAQPGDVLKVQSDKGAKPGWLGERDDILPSLYGD